MDGIPQAAVNGTGRYSEAKGWTVTAGPKRIEIVFEKSRSIEYTIAIWAESPVMTDIA